MGKESETENLKKRRKSVSGNNVTVVKEEDIYKVPRKTTHTLIIIHERILQTIISYEEKEAKERLPEQDSECFLQTCDVIRKTMNKIAKLKVDHNVSIHVNDGSNV